MISVLVVDDDALVRSGLRMMLAGAAGLAVVAEAADGREVLGAVDHHRPDVVLMDIRMPQLDGIAATRLLAAQPDPPAVLVLTTFDADELVLRALQAGAAGFLLKDTPPAEIVRAIELGPLARADARVVLLDTIPGVGDLLGLTLASEIGDVARFGSPRKLIGYAGLAPKVNQSGDRSRTGALSKAGSRTLRWAVVEAAQHAWRPTNPWHQLYTDLAARAGKNPAKTAVARKILIAAWHVLSRNQPFKAPAPRPANPASASSRCFLAA